MINNLVYLNTNIPMEIFLLLVLITLVIIFYSTHNTKFAQLQQRITELQNQLNEALTHAKPQETQQKTVTDIKQVHIEQKIVPPVVKEEEKIIEKKKEEVPPVIEIKKEAERINIPVIENPVIKNKPPVSEPQLSWWEKFKDRNPDLEKFIGENLLSKIAITILVLGIAFFVKYAIDKDWINEAARVGIGVLCGSVVMGFAHKLRLNFKAFSSVLVAGAIAIFYFTIAIGFHEYHLFSQTVAFIIMLVITSFSVFISVAYDRVELAALAITGGFAVPFMLSTGAGNYKVLFTYILILDLGMLALAYLKKWNLINILTYAFTVVLYSAWLESKVVNIEHAPYKGAFFFGLIFYTVFVFMNVINNIKERRPFTYVELIILISNTFVFYISGMLVLHEWHSELKGIYTTAMALFNFILAFSLYKYFKADKKLVYLLIGMTLSFATLAAPVQLKGNYITLFWGAETALLIWLGWKTELKGFKLASIMVSVLMFFSLMMDFAQVYLKYSDSYLSPCLNKGFITGILSSVFLIIGFFLLKKEESANFSGINPRTYGTVLKIAGVFLAYLTGFLEIHHQSSYYISSENSVVSISCFYHVVFTSLLGLYLLKKYSQVNLVISFVLLSFNFLYYLLIYSIAPYSELTERSRAEHGSYMGYVVHFIALTALTFHTIYMIRNAITRQNFIITAKSVLLWIFGTLIISVLSNEVVLSLMEVKLNGFVRNADYFVVESVYSYIHTQVIKIALPILWGLIAFMFLSVGIKRQIRQMRVMALALLALTLLKLFTYDIKDVSEAGKIIAFIILGIVLLIMSFMYQKIKAIILNEEPVNDTNSTDEIQTD